MHGFFNQSPNYRPLILEIDTTKAGSASDTFILPVRANKRYVYVVEWGDGTSEKSTTATNLTHVYPASGVYRVKVHGVGFGRSFPVLYFYNLGDKDKLINVLSFGDIIYAQLGNMLYGCSNLLTIPGGKFNCRESTSGLSFLRSCSKFNSPLYNIDFSGTTDLTYLLSGCTAFNQPLTGMDTRNVTSFAGMLTNCTAFKQDLSFLDIRSLTNASSMLSGTNINDTGTTTRYDALLNAWAAQPFKNSVAFHAGSAKYSAAGAAARATLAAAGWTITDGGLA